MDGGSPVPRKKDPKKASVRFVCGVSESPCLCGYEPNTPVTPLAQHLVTPGWRPNTSPKRSRFLHQLHEGS